MKVVKSKFPKELIDHMVACPLTLLADIYDEENFAQCTPDFRQVYATAKFLEAKDREYILGCPQSSAGRIGLC
jgi:ADP-heptose:LPS heptosyltransferase